MLAKTIIFFLLITFNSKSFASDYFNLFYKVETGDTFSSILKKFVKDSAIINAKTPMVIKTIQKNPHVHSWGNLAPGTVINLYISNDFIELAKYRPYEEEENRKKLSSEKDKTVLPIYPKGLKGSVFYMASLGIFTQKAENVAEINFKQNSKVSLGTAFSFYPKDKLYSMSTSTYFSFLSASSNSLTAESVKIPPEIGFNLYGEYLWKKQNLTFYSGPDYEKFSIFNLQSLQSDQKVYVDGVGALYLTAGIAKSFVLFDGQFFSKISASKSLSTTYKTSSPSSAVSASDGKYSGVRFMFYLNYKLNPKFYIQSLLKIHTMTGPSDLSVTRVGLGVGYVLF